MSNTATVRVTKQRKSTHVKLNLEDIAMIFVAVAQSQDGGQWPITYHCTVLLSLYAARNADVMADRSLDEPDTERAMLHGSLTAAIVPAISRRITQLNHSG